MFERTLTIFSDVLLPVLAMVAVGAIVQWRLKLHLQTLVRLNLYLFVPAFLFVRISDSRLNWGDIGGMAVACLVPMAMLGVPLFFMLRRMKASGRTIAATLICGLFYNAGNFGIPVIELAFGPRGGSVQALVVMFMNTMIFFIGYVVLSLAQGGGWRQALGYFRLPMIYAIIAAFLVRDTELEAPRWLDEAARLIAGGMVPIALVTLGAQLASNSPRAALGRWRVVLPVTLLKLLIVPAVTWAAVWMLGLWPWPGAVLVLASAAPTAVNTLLLSLELDGDAETAAQCVFWTTLLSAVTVTLWLALLYAADPTLQ